MNYWKQQRNYLFYPSSNVMGVLVVNDPEEFLRRDDNCILNASDGVMQAFAEDTTLLHSFRKNSLDVIPIAILDGVLYCSGILGISVLTLKCWDYLLTEKPPAKTLC